MVNVSYSVLFDKIKKSLVNAGLDEHSANLCAEVHSQSTLDGVNSHGVNRIPRFVEYVEKGWVRVDCSPEIIKSLGSVEIYDGRCGIGVVNALMAIDRAIHMARENGVGIVALRNTTHWMRGGSYGWRAAEKGLASICWTNTESCMPAWGGEDQKIGNNPLVISVPRKQGAFVLDMAMSQFSYGKLQSTRLKGGVLPFFGGYNKVGEITDDPAAIEESRRILPMGYWKGSGLSIMLDAMAALLSEGLASHQIDRVGKGSGTGASQVFMVFDPRHFGGEEFVEEMANGMVDHICGPLPCDTENSVKYPGQSTLERRRLGLKFGINVDDDVWEKVLELSR
ncbi:3-dehydro-L-gulonate 2-dehydrogenase [Halomonas sp. M5N1S17]|uniref:3-dehydro-L-gulonate 2-dehydrogenase n=1 Tax=Halomonas alkalisoli TaxID=2907158 RepID=UPI001F22B9C4|nr:3-dehydro-L-gulonate 2-dehydrogenase [Halomonas alkalisoli]MCE9662184.1 3-dehydro-L-gulonate 2-dehydrogenase [Halomonas alkalisoli]